jgi:hypothetical protein
VTATLRSPADLLTERVFDALIAADLYPRPLSDPTATAVRVGSYGGEVLVVTKELDWRERAEAALWRAGMHPDGSDLHPLHLIIHRRDTPTTEEESWAP